MNRSQFHLFIYFALAGTATVWRRSMRVRWDSINGIWFGNFCVPECRYGNLNFVRTVHTSGVYRQSLALFRMERHEQMNFAFGRCDFAGHIFPLKIMKSHDCARTQEWDSRSHFSNCVWTERNDEFRWRDCRHYLRLNWSRNEVTHSGVAIFDRDNWWFHLFFGCCFCFKFGIFLGQRVALRHNGASDRTFIRFFRNFDFKLDSSGMGLGATVGNLCAFLASFAFGRTIKMRASVREGAREIVVVIRWEMLLEGRHWKFASGNRTKCDDASLVSLSRACSHSRNICLGDLS